MVESKQDPEESGKAPESSLEKQDSIDDLPPEVVQIVRQLRSFSIESSSTSPEGMIFDKITKEHISKVLEIRLTQVEQAKDSRESLQRFYFNTLISILVFLLVVTLFLGYRDINAFVELVKLLGQAIALIFGGIGIKSLFDKSQNS